MRHELTWGETPVCATYGALVESAECPPPAPKTTYVSIPGGVDLDLTDALTGHAAYENRTVTITLFLTDRDEAHKALNLLHGAESDFELSWDPGYTYHGRASVTGSTEWPGQGVRLVVQITANPWKLREAHRETVSALGYAELDATCGTRPVHPVISCEYPVVVTLRGQSVTVPAGERYRVVGLTLLPGANELLLQMFSYEQARWSDVSHLTWEQLSGRRWGDLWVTDEPVTPEGGLPGSPDVTVEWEEYYL